MRDVAQGRVVAWAAPRWFAERLPAPLLNDIGREFESALFLDRIRHGAGSLYKIRAYQQATAWRERGYRNLFHPGDFFGDYLHGFPREDVDYALDGPAADLVMRLLGEERGFQQEIETCRVHAALHELGTGSLTPPALMMPPGKSCQRRRATPPCRWSADAHYLRSRAGDAPRLVCDGDGFESFPDLYRKLVPELCGWTFDRRASRKDCDLLRWPRGALSWALLVERPSKRDECFPQLVLRSSDRKALRSCCPAERRARSWSSG